LPGLLVSRCRACCSKAPPAAPWLHRYNISYGNERADGEPDDTTDAPAGSEIVLLELVALFLTVATIWILLNAIKTFTPDDFENPNFVYFGLTIIICNEMAARFGRSTVLPLGLSLRKIVPVTVTYIGLSAWVWLRRRKL
jgi:hypothetical protein